MDTAGPNEEEDQENFEDTYMSDLRVQQKYTGHRNARWDYAMLLKFLTYT